MRYLLPLFLTVSGSPPPFLLAEAQTKPLTTVLEAETGRSIPRFEAYVLDSIGVQDKIGTVEFDGSLFTIYISMEDDVTGKVTSDVLRTALAHELVHVCFNDSAHENSSLWWALEGYEAGVKVHEAGLLRRIWRRVNNDERGLSQLPAQ